MQVCAFFFFNTKEKKRFVPHSPTPRPLPWGADIPPLSPCPYPQRRGPRHPPPSPGGARRRPSWAPGCHPPATPPPPSQPGARTGPRPSRRARRSHASGMRAPRAGRPGESPRPPAHHPLLDHSRRVAWPECGERGRRPCSSPEPSAHAPTHRPEARRAAAASIGRRRARAAPCPRGPGAGQGRSAGAALRGGAGEPRPAHGAQGGSPHVPRAAARTPAGQQGPERLRFLLLLLSGPGSAASRRCRRPGSALAPVSALPRGGAPRAARDSLGCSRRPSKAGRGSAAPSSLGQPVGLYKLGPRPPGVPASAPPRRPGAPRHPLCCSTRLVPGTGPHGTGCPVGAGEPRSAHFPIRPPPPQQPWRGLSESVGAGGAASSPAVAARSAREKCPSPRLLGEHPTRKCAPRGRSS